MDSTLQYISGLTILITGLNFFDKIQVVHGQLHFLLDLATLLTLSSNSQQTNIRIVEPFILEDFKSFRDIAVIEVFAGLGKLRKRGLLLMINLK